MENNDKGTLDWEEIGRRFEKCRLTNKHNQLEIIAKAKTFKGSISKIEKGKEPASVNYALFLRNEFGVSFDWLYDGIETDRNYDDVQAKKIINPITIGKRLKAIRDDKKMNQEEFGKLIGVQAAAVSKYERGHRTPEIKTALKIKRALGKPLDWIYFGDEVIIPKKLVRQSNLNQIKSAYLTSKEKVKEKLSAIRIFPQLFSVLNG